MVYKVGDKVKVGDRSYGFGIDGGEYARGAPYLESLTIVATGLDVMMHANGKKEGRYTEVNDLLVTDGKDGYWFTQSRFCKPVEKKIEIRYFSDGRDVTDRISDETKRNLRAL